jgi:ssDNA-binding Zn-finger/Zn-ribbon topoisomerase 1
MEVKKVRPEEERVPSEVKVTMRVPRVLYNRIKARVNKINKNLLSCCSNLDCGYFCSKNTKLETCPQCGSVMNHEQEAKVKSTALEIVQVFFADQAMRKMRASEIDEKVLKAVAQG